MNDYIELRVDLTPYPGEDATDLIAATLGDVGFETFVPDQSGLTAYIPAPLFSKDDLDDLFADFPFDTKITWHDKFIEGRDWNAEWEQNYFKPIIVAERCVVHSTFHKDVPHADYDIVIDPKMAFGTGHHATTSLMLQRLLSADLEGKSLIDMGTGTGILAILAAMRGANPVTGIEIDEFAYKNACENIVLNDQSQIKLINGDASALETVEPANYFLANINRNVIIADIEQYTKATLPGGHIFLSGFYIEDIPVIRKAAEAAGLKYIDYIECDNWVSVKLEK